MAIAMAEEETSLQQQQPEPNQQIRKSPHLNKDHEAQQNLKLQNGAKR